MMNIILILFVLVIAFGICFMSIPSTSQSRKAFISIILFFLTMESCMRGIGVGSDTYKYEEMFAKIELQTWDNLWKNLITRYTENSSTEDVGYLIFMKFVQIFSTNFQFFLFVCALFFFIPFGKLLYKYTTDNRQLTFIFIFYVALFNMIAMSGVRKEMALGMAVLFILYYTEKKYVKMATALLIGVLIHMTTLLILLVPLVNFIPKKYLRYVHIGAFAAIPFILSAMGPMLVLMANVVDNEHYEKYGEQTAQGGAGTFFLLIELLSLFCLWSFRKIDIKNDSILSKMYAMLPLFTIFAPLIQQSGSMIRISQYFHLYLLILLPYAVETYFKKSGTQVVYFALSLILILLALRTTDDSFYFFWQNAPE